MRRSVTWRGCIQQLMALMSGAGMATQDRTARRIFAVPGMHGAASRAAPDRSES